MQKKFLDSVSFYITNVCGLACPGCVTFNNYKVKGHYHWNNTKEKAYKWANLINVRQITIVGGEPLLHPGIDEWTMGIADAFKHCDDIRILTGLVGKSLIKKKDLIRKWIDNNVIIQISVHDPSWWDIAKENAKEILDGYEYTQVDGIDEGGSFPLKKTEYFDKNGKRLFSMMELWAFFPSAQKEVKDGLIYLHDNDPTEAFNACYCKTCQYIVDGDMYNCAITGTAGMMLEQLPLDQRSKNILSHVKGIGPDDNNPLDFTSPVDACSLCSTNMTKLFPIFPIPIKKPDFPSHDDKQPVE